MPEKKIILTPKDFFVNTVKIDGVETISVKHLPSGSYAAASTFPEAMGKVLQQLEKYYRNKWKVIYKDGQKVVR